jgi:hypothetical protein
VHEHIHRRAAPALKYWQLRRSEFYVANSITIIAAFALSAARPGLLRRLSKKSVRDCELRHFINLAWPMMQGHAATASLLPQWRRIAAPVRDRLELDSAVAAQACEPNSGLIAMPDSFTDAHRVEIISLEARSSCHLSVPVLR